MGPKDIKSGTEIVSEFIKSLEGDASIDAETLTAVRELLNAGNLSKSRLLSALTALRTSALAQHSDAAKKEGSPPHD